MRTISEGQLVSSAHETRGCFSALVLIPKNPFLVHSNGMNEGAILQCYILFGFYFHEHFFFCDQTGSWQCQYAGFYVKC